MRITAEKKYQRRWLTLAVLSLSLVIIGLDNTILNIALPTLQRDLGASASELQWMVDGYVLVFAGLLLTMGALGDRFGRGGALTAGLVIFGGASLIASETATAGQLIAARSMMGIGGALIMPATLSIITDVFPREERGKAIGIWAGVAGAGIGLGPIVGGFLLEYFWWGSVFLVNLPIVLTALIAGYFLVPTSRDPEATPLDIPGAVLSMVAIASLVYAIIEGPSEGWTSGLVLGGFAIAAVFGIAFLVVELRTRYPMLNLSFFANRRFSGGATAIGIAFFSLFGVVFVLTQYLQFVQGYTALEAGIRTAPIAIGMIIGSSQAPRVVEKIGTTRVVSAGLVVLALTLASYSTTDTRYELLVRRHGVDHSSDGDGNHHGSIDGRGYGSCSPSQGRCRFCHKRRSPSGCRRHGCGHCGISPQLGVLGTDGRCRRPASGRRCSSSRQFDRSCNRCRRKDACRVGNTTRDGGTPCLRRLDGSRRLHRLGSGAARCLPGCPLHAGAAPTRNGRTGRRSRGGVDGTGHRVGERRDQPHGPGERSQRTVRSRYGSRR